MSAPPATTFSPAVNPNPWFDRPNDVDEEREIEGQLCIWDDSPREEFGQVWIPVCSGCYRGPLSKGELTCGECE